MHLLGRRSIIAGLGAGATLLGAFARGLVNEARGAPPARRRFILFTNGNGFLQKHYTCTARSESDFELSSVYAPLASWKRHMIIASPLYIPFDKALHGNQFATLSIMPSPERRDQYRGPPGGISFDRFLAREIGAGDAFPSTAAGVEELPGRVLCVSADGPRQPFPAIGSPLKAYDTFFGATVGAEVGAEQLLASERSVLDYVRGDIERVSARLAGAERAKLDQYLDSMRALEQQLSRLAGIRGTCAEAPGAPSANTAWHNPLVHAAHIDVAFAAQRCGLTRVSHVSILGMEAPFNSYKWLDAGSHHNNHHEQKLDKVHVIETYILSKVAQMVARLDSTPEGDGTMLDNSVVCYVNTCGGSHHRGWDTHAALVIGAGGGALRTGRYLRFEPNTRCISDLFVALARALGVRIDSFGDPVHNRGPLPGLL